VREDVTDEQVARRMSEKDLTRRLGLRATPTLLFLDESGALAERASGYLEPRAFVALLERASPRASAPRSAWPAGRRAPM
jgi:thioredoxin-related protein